MRANCTSSATRRKLIQASVVKRLGTASRAGVGNLATGAGKCMLQKLQELNSLTGH